MTADQLQKASDTVRRLATLIPVEQFVTKTMVEFFRDHAKYSAKELQLAYQTRLTTIEKERARKKANKEQKKAEAAGLANAARDQARVAAEADLNSPNGSNSNIARAKEAAKKTAEEAARAAQEIAEEEEKEEAAKQASAVAAIEAVEVSVAEDPTDDEDPGTPTAEVKSGERARGAASKKNVVCIVVVPSVFCSRFGADVQPLVPLGDNQADDSFGSCAVPYYRWQDAGVEPKYRLYTDYVKRHCPKLFKLVKKRAVQWQSTTDGRRPPDAPMHAFKYDAKGLEIHRAVNDTEMLAVAQSQLNTIQSGGSIFTDAKNASLSAVPKPDEIKARQMLTAKFLPDATATYKTELENGDLDELAKESVFISTHTPEQSGGNVRNTIAKAIQKFAERDVPQIQEMLPQTSEPDSDRIDWTEFLRKNGVRLGGFGREGVQVPAIACWVM